jgi:hypothetical protein
VPIVNLSKVVQVCIDRNAVIQFLGRMSTDELSITMSQVRRCSSIREKRDNEATGFIAFSQVQRTGSRT